MKVVVEEMGTVSGKNIMKELPPREVYIHFTTATDTNNIKKVFESVHEIILQNVIKTVLYWFICNFEIWLKVCTKIKYLSYIKERQQGCKQMF